MPMHRGVADPQRRDPGSSTCSSMLLVLLIGSESFTLALLLLLGNVYISIISGVGFCFVLEFWFCFSELLILLQCKM